MKAIITVGVSASGKSTFAREYVQANPDAIKIDRDDLRFSLRCAMSWGEYQFNKKVERMVTLAHEAMITFAGKHCMDVVIAETSLTPKTRARLVQLLKAAGYSKITFKDFPITLEEAIERDSKRQYSVGESVIRKQYVQWLEYLQSKEDDSCEHLTS
jgi:predicted kinase